jgi:hypothetical protein
MANSSVLDFEMALITNLQNRQGLFGVQILDGPPTAGQSQKGEFIMFGNTRGGQKYKLLPGKVSPGREEKYTTDVYINVVQAITNTQNSATKRAFALMKEIEDELRNNPSQNVAQVAWSDMATSLDVRKAQNPTQGWRETLIITGITVNARL